MKKALGISALFALSSQVLAHPGHDHAHWLSEPIHALTALAIVAIAGTGAYVLRKRTKSQKTEK